MDSALSLKAILVVAVAERDEGEWHAASYALPGLGQYKSKRASRKREVSSRTLVQIEAILSPRIIAERTCPGTRTHWLDGRLMAQTPGSMRR